MSCGISRQQRQQVLGLRPDKSSNQPTTRESSSISRKDEDNDGFIMHPTLLGGIKYGLPLSVHSSVPYGLVT